jgi:glutaredoxin-dependent peroxiredoxin
MCTFRDQTQQLNSMNAQVVGVSVDPQGAQKAFADQNNLQFPILSDFNREVTNQYGVAWPNFGGMQGYVVANRSVLVLDKDGVVRYKWVAPNPGTEPNYDEVRDALAKLG